MTWTPSSIQPLTDVGGVIRCTKDELWRSVVPRTDIADVRFAGDQDLGGTKVAKLEHTRCGVQEQVLWLDISVTDADRVDVHKGAQELVHVELDLQHRHRLLELGIVATRTIHGLRDVFEHKIEIDFVFLWPRGISPTITKKWPLGTGRRRNSPCRRLNRRKPSGPLR